MSASNKTLGPIVLLVVAVGLVGLVGWDQMRQHAKPAAPKTAAVEPAEMVPDNGLPVIIEGDSVGRPTQIVAPPSAADTTGHQDQLPPGEVMTI